jgi:hypothetical protein
MVTGGGHFRMTMTVDTNMEFEKKGLGNSEKVMDLVGPWRCTDLCASQLGRPCVVHNFITVQL